MARTTGQMDGLLFAINRILRAKHAHLTSGKTVRTLPSCFNNAEVDYARKATHDPNLLHDKRMMAQLQFLDETGRPHTYSKRPVVMGTMMEFYAVNKLMRENLVPEGYHLASIETGFKSMLFPDERFCLDVNRVLPKSASPPSTLAGPESDIDYQVGMFSVPEGIQHIEMTVSFSYDAARSVKEPVHKEQDSIAIALSLDDLLWFSQAIHVDKCPVSYLLALSSGAIARSLETNERLKPLADDTVFPVYASHKISLNPRINAIGQDFSERKHRQALFNVGVKNKGPLYFISVDAYIQPEGLVTLPEHLYTFKSTVAVMPRKEIVEKHLMDVQTLLGHALLALDPRRYI